MQRPQGCGRASGRSAADEPCPKPSMQAFRALRAAPVAAGAEGGVAAAALAAARDRDALPGRHQVRDALLRRAGGARARAAPARVISALLANVMAAVVACGAGRARRRMWGERRRARLQERLLPGGLGARGRRRPPEHDGAERHAQHAVGAAHADLALLAPALAGRRTLQVLQRLQAPRAGGARGLGVRPPRWGAGPPGHTRGRQAAENIVGGPGEFRTAQARAAEGSAATPPRAIRRLQRRAGRSGRAAGRRTGGRPGPGRRRRGRRCRRPQAGTCPCPRSSTGSRTRTRRRPRPPPGAPARRLWLGASADRRECGRLWEDAAKCLRLAPETCLVYKDLVASPGRKCVAVQLLLLCRREIGLLRVQARSADPPRHRGARPLCEAHPRCSCQELPCLQSSRSAA